MRTTVVTTIAALLASALSAQEQKSPPEPRMFLPRDYNVEARVDVDALIESGLFDVLERSFVRPFMESFGRSFGFYLSEVDTFRLAQRQRVGDKGWPEFETVMIFVGTDKVALHEQPLRDSGMELAEEQIGGSTVLVADDEAIVSPRKGALVQGSRSLVEATLRGEHLGGVPVPDLLALTAEPGAIAYLAGMVTEQYEHEREIDPIPGHWFDPEDPPHALMLRLDPRAEGEGMVIEFRVRFRDGDRGAEHFREEFDRWLGSLGEDPRLRLISRTLRETKSRIDHRDFVATLEMEEPARIFSLLLNMTSTMLFRAFDGAAAAPVQIVEVEAVEVVEEEEEPEEAPGPRDDPAPKSEPK